MPQKLLGLSASYFLTCWRQVSSLEGDPVKMSFLADWESRATVTELPAVTGKVSQTLLSALERFLPYLPHLAAGLAAIGLMLVAVIFSPGLSSTMAPGGLGLASFAVGFAFEDICENLFAGFILLWRYPFEKGDCIERERGEGKVKQALDEAGIEIPFPHQTNVFNEPLAVVKSGEEEND